MFVVVAPDSFKGVLDAGTAAQAMREGVIQARGEAEVVIVPMADGGEGTLDVLVDAENGQRRRMTATGSLGDAVEVTVGLIRQASTAVVELATVAGYSQVPAARRDASTVLRTSTYGLGEVIRAVVEMGIEEIVLTVGGSATVDGGAGMMQAMGMTLLDRSGRVMSRHAGGGDLAEIGRIVWELPPENMEHVRITIASDVLNPACGPSGAAAVFGPQKGADAAGVAVLDRGLSHWANLLEGASGRVVRDEPGTGAAGGVALPLLAMCGASIVPGVDIVCEANGLADQIGRADLVLTGEGRLDRQSLMGKVVGSVGRLSRGAGVPCVAIVGAAGEGAEDCLSVIDRYETLGGAISDTEARLVAAAGRVAAKML